MVQVRSDYCEEAGEVGSTTPHGPRVYVNECMLPILNTQLEREATEEGLAPRSSLTCALPACICRLRCASRRVPDALQPTRGPGLAGLSPHQPRASACLGRTTPPRSTHHSTDPPVPSTCPINGVLEALLSGQPSQIYMWCSIHAAMLSQWFASVAGLSSGCESSGYMSMRVGTPLARSVW